MGLLEDLKEKILVADGAMGTMLYSAGIDSCFEELNLSQPQKVLEIHNAYIKAGAKIIQTNTYGANTIKLSRYGLQSNVREINAAGVRLARQAAGNQYVLGTLGGIRGVNKNIATLEEIKASFVEQCEALLEASVDGLILETYYDLEELKTVLQLARARTKLPIIAQVSLIEPERLQDGTLLYDALKELEALGADVVGLNCRLGPYHMLQALDHIPLLETAYLSVYPNASYPDYVDGRYEYNSNASYFEQIALEFRNQGVRLIGGCCGTTPWHIEAMADKLRGLSPIKKKLIKEHSQNVEVIAERKPLQQKHLHEQVKSMRSVIVELDPPKSLNINKFMAGAQALKKVGIDAITLADNSLASPRISNMAMATIVKDQFNLRPLVHVACRDRNIIGLQSHLLGLHALGLNQVLAITGDPTKVGDFPGATSVFDVSSMELLELIKRMNEGLSFSGQSLQERTAFSVAAAFNPNVKKLDRAVQRLERKVRQGADYFITQPLYSAKQIVEVYEATKHLDKPIYIGIMPLVSSRNAEFLHNEVPGIKLSDDIRQAMASVSHNKLKSEKEGLSIAKFLIDAAFDLFNGIYLITPFMRYELSVELTAYIQKKEQDKAEREVFNG